MFTEKYEIEYVQHEEEMEEEETDILNFIWRVKILFALLPSYPVILESKFDRIGICKQDKPIYRHPTLNSDISQ